MDKPKHVSEAAWEFACSRHGVAADRKNRFGQVYMTADEALESMRLTSAELFDIAAAPLVEAVNRVDGEWSRGSIDSEDSAAIDLMNALAKFRKEDR